MMELTGLNKKGQQNIRYIQDDLSCDTQCEIPLPTSRRNKKKQFTPKKKVNNQVKVRKKTKSKKKAKEKNQGKKLPELPYFTKKHQIEHKPIFYSKSTKK